MRDFLKYTFASFLGIVLFVTLGFGGLIVLVVAISTASQNAEPTIDDKSILTVDLSTPISDAPSALDPGEVIGGTLTGADLSRPLPLRRVLDALALAAEDDDIVGLYLYGSTSDGITGGLAALAELRAALEHFAASGKPIFAYTHEWTERDFYLTSVADTLVMHPVGYAEINGYSSEAVFFAGALEKFGIGIQPVRVGRYKSAVEPYILTQRSPEEREQTQTLLSDLWADFLTTTSVSRDISAQALQAIATTEGLLLPQAAKTAGLVDQVAYFDELLPDLHQLTGEEADEPTFRHVHLADYVALKVEEETPAVGDGQIALVYAEGEIVSGEGGPGLIGGDRFASQIRDLRVDEEVDAVVLRINSPGGSATASDQIAREIFLTQKVKPVIVSMSGVAASGGYQIATYADQIFALSTTITGSIGVFGLLPNIQEISNNNGITWDIVKTAPLADANTITRPKTPEELAIIQQVVDQLYDQFINSVAESRSLSREQVDAIAQGRVWSGVEAQRIGLVDELGGLDKALDAAAEAAELGEDWYVKEYPEFRSLEQRIITNLFSSQVSSLAVRQDPITTQLQALWQDAAILRTFNDPLGVYARMPYSPRIH